MVKLTEKQLNLYTKNLHSKCIALNKQQIELLNIDWPPEKGWVKKLINTEIDILTHTKLIELRGKGVSQITQTVKLRLKLEKQVCKLGGKITWYNN